MTSSRAIGLLLLLAALSAACSSHTVAPPVSPPTQKKAARDPDVERERAREPRLVAPPPAYGNKVVLAQGDGSADNG